MAVGGQFSCFRRRKTDVDTHSARPATHSVAFPAPTPSLFAILSLAPAGAFCLGGTANGRRDTSRKTLRALTSIFAASVHACWPWPLGKVHRSNSCCMHLMAGNKIAGKPATSLELQGGEGTSWQCVPPSFQSLTWGCPPVTPSSLLTESQTGLPAVCVLSSFHSRFFVETCWVKKARMTQARPNNHFANESEAVVSRSSHDVFLYV